MALPFLKNQSRRRDQIVAIDLGSRMTKAVHLQRKGDGLAIASYVSMDAPAYDNGLASASLSKHLTEVSQAIGTRCRQVSIAIGVGDSLLRRTELPLAPVSDLRVMLKFNAKNYLQQDLPDHTFDCHVMTSAPSSKPDASKQNATKCNVLVGGARKQTLDNLQAAAKAAGFQVEQIVPGLIGPPNAFELTHPEVFASEPVALVDLGFKNSSITILLNGELMLSRVVALGGDRLTTGVAEALGVSYTEAEGIKVGLPDEVQSTMVGLLAPLGRELRASIDFFEHQQDKTINQVFVSGGSARSEYINQILQTELMVPCTSWNPAGFLALALPARLSGELDQTAPQLTTAIGAGVAAF